MPIARSSILRGPAVIVFGGSTFYTRDDITVEMSLDTFEIPTSAHGKVDERVGGRVMRVRFTPAGEWEGLSVLWPYGSTTIGTGIFGSSDTPCTIQTLSGTRLILAAAAVTQMPEIVLSATQTLIGAVEITGIGADNTAWTTDESLVEIDSNAFSDATFDPANIKTQPYTAAWGGSSPWSSFQTAGGFNVSFDLNLGPLEVDSEGLVDMTFGGLAVRVRCQPLGITETQLISALAVQGTGNTRGRSLQASANDLVISGTGVVVTVKKAAMRAGGLSFGPTALRIGEVEFVATRQFVTGVAQALFTVATS